MSPGQLVYFDMYMDGQRAGRIVFRLFDDECPVTSRNFRELCTGAPGYGYAGSIIHRVNPTTMICGGDITNRDGTGGKSAFGRAFSDESFAIKHDRAGILSMGNHGPNSNTSLFFITTQPASWCDPLHVAFGEVVTGLEIVHMLQTCPTDGAPRGRPSKEIIIKGCGILKD